jgi:hypothetical protein
MAEERREMEHRERVERTDVGSASPPLVDEYDDDLPASMSVRAEDLEPHAGLRYIARLLKILALLIVVLLVAEVTMGLVQDGASAIPALLIEATRLVVFTGLLWAAGDISLMLIESNHDLRATRILVGRLNGRIERMEEAAGVEIPRERHDAAPPPAPPPGA